MNRRLLLPSKNTIWNLTVAAPSDLQLKCLTSLHSMTSSLLGAVPVTAQKTFWPVPTTGKRSSHHGATRVAICEIGRGSLEGTAKVLLLKFTFPLLPTNRVLKLPPPKRIGNGEVIAADESSPKSRLVPVIIR